VTPHLLNYVTGPDGTVIDRYKTNGVEDAVDGRAGGPNSSLIGGRSRSTHRYGVFPRPDDVAAKTEPPRPATVRRTPTTG